MSRSPLDDIAIAAAEFAKSRAQLLRMDASSFIDSSALQRVIAESDTARNNAELQRKADEKATSDEAKFMVTVKMRKIVEARKQELSYRVSSFNEEYASVIEEYTSGTKKVETEADLDQIEELTKKFLEIQKLSEEIKSLESFTELPPSLETTPLADAGQIRAMNTLSTSDPGSSIVLAADKKTDIPAANGTAAPTADKKADAPAKGSPDTTQSSAGKKADTPAKTTPDVPAAQGATGGLGTVLTDKKMSILSGEVSKGYCTIPRLQNKIDSSAVLKCHRLRFEALAVAYADLHEGDTLTPEKLRGMSETEVSKMLNKIKEMYDIDLTTQSFGKQSGDINAFEMKVKQLKKEVSQKFGKDIDPLACNDEEIKSALSDFKGKVTAYAQNNINVPSSSDLLNSSPGSVSPTNLGPLATESAGVTAAV